MHGTNILRCFNEVEGKKVMARFPLAGIASESLLETTSKYFAGGVNPNRLTESLLKQPLESSMRWKLKPSTSGLNEDNSCTITSSKDNGL